MDGLGKPSKKLNDQSFGGGGGGGYPPYLIISNSFLLILHFIDNNVGLCVVLNADFIK